MSTKSNKIIWQNAQKRLWPINARDPMINIRSQCSLREVNKTERERRNIKWISATTNGEPTDKCFFPMRMCNSIFICCSFFFFVTFRVCTFFFQVILSACERHYTLFFSPRNRKIKWQNNIVAESEIESLLLSHSFIFFFTFNNSHYSFFVGRMSFWSR